MKPISSSAKHAAEKKEKRYWNKKDLEDVVGVTRGEAYELVNSPTDEKTVLLVTDITHKHDPVTDDGETKWHRPHGEAKETFLDKTRIHGKLYRYGDWLNRNHVGSDPEPIQRPTIFRKALSKFKRKSVGLKD